MTNFDSLLKADVLNGFGIGSNSSKISSSFFNGGEEIYTGFLKPNNLVNSILKDLGSSIGLDADWMNFGDINTVLNNPPEIVQDALKGGGDLGQILNNPPPMVQDALNYDYNFLF